ncbi:MAG: outer membrane beta-barrel domain-containing protein [Bdellovibrionota bacterium]
MLRTRLYGIMILFIISSADAVTSAADANTTDLEEQLSTLGIPTNEVPPQASLEKIYAVQTRFSPLKYRSELSLGGGRNLSADGFIVTNQADLGYRFHITDRWSVGLTTSTMFNSMTDSAKHLFERDQMLPDIAYAKYRFDANIGCNLFYGKFRVTMDKVFYFDQYVSLGAGIVELDTGRIKSAVVDAGISLWLGRRGSIRIGLKDYIFNERRRLSSGIVNQFVGHMDLGLMIGG